MVMLALVLGLSGCGQVPSPSGQPARDDRITAMGAVELQRRMVDGELTAEQVTSAFLERIQRLDQDGPRLNAIIEVNPAALSIARSLDRALAETGPVGVLHGVPVILKANIDTADAMSTSAGSLALANHYAAEDAHIVTLLRRAGAVILAKANLSEWANFRSENSTSGWSSLGGQTRHPYLLDRNPCGSSSGSAVAVAARLAPLAIGTETNGSIVCPSGQVGIVGLKPTTGRISRHGIVPIAISQDTAGPMARSVGDLALLMQVIDVPDPRDQPTLARGEITPVIQPNPRSSLATFRIGVWRNYWGAGTRPEVDALLEKQAALLAGLGAEVVDVEINTDQVGDLSYQVLLYEFKDGINRYLESVNDPGAPGSLDALISFNREHAEQVMPHFGQDILIASQAKGDLRSPEYIHARTESLRLASQRLREALNGERVDALITVTNGPAWRTDLENGDDFSMGSSTLAAVAGHPNLTLPMGLVDGLPVGLSIMSRRGSEHLLIQLAYELERQRDFELEPGFLESLSE